MSQWIVTMIVQERALEKRATLIQTFLEIAEVLFIHSVTNRNHSNVNYCEILIPCWKCRRNFSAWITSAV